MKICMYTVNLRRFACCLVVTRWETPNKYQIKNSLGQPVFFASEGNLRCDLLACYASVLRWGHKAMLPSVRPSVCLSVPFSDPVSFARWRHVCVAISNAVDRGQYGVHMLSASAYRLSVRHLDGIALFCNEIILQSG